jgi:hypothetical protein
MKTIKQNWSKLAGVITLACLTFGIAFVCISAWAQSLPGLSIALSSSNQVVLTVTNGLPTGIYHIYFAQDVNASGLDWSLATNGTTGQTNFTFSMEDFDQGFFKAVNDTNFISPSLTVIIQGPANGSVVF